MQEGVLSLLQMAKTAQLLGRLDEAGLLTVSLVTDPTYGGVAASFATLCDVVVAEPRARLGFAGPRVIEQIVREALPAGFQTAEVLFERGLIDAIVPRGELRPALARLLAAAAPTPTPTSPAPGARGAADAAAPAASPPGPVPSAGGAPLPLPPERPERPERPDTLAEVPAPSAPGPAGAGGSEGAWTVVQHARDPRRPTTLDYVGRIIEGFQELHGDRLGGADCPAVVAGVGRLAGRPVAVVGHQKGHRPAELVARNFGMPTPAGYRKVARVLRLAAKLRLPVVTLVDTPGAHPGVEAEEQGQAVAVAECLRLLSALPVPVVAVVTGEGGSGGALALGIADRLLILSGAYFSVISPEGCAAILWDDPAAAPRAAEALRLTAADLHDLGVVDEVLPEPPGGVQADHDGAAAVLAAALRRHLDELVPRSPADLVARRRARLRSFGTAGTTPVPAAVAL
jgi:acetyl-CoA carboxylase carboxyl transferase subunit beta